jgi:hypothetical protein
MYLQYFAWVSLCSSASKVSEGLISRRAKSGYPRFLWCGKPQNNILMPNLGIIGQDKNQMEEKKQIWAYRSMKKGDYDNDYFFYEDGSILHHYDRTKSKRDIESFVSPTDISEIDKVKIIEKCKAECDDIVIRRIKNILCINE